MSIIQVHNICNEFILNSDLQQLAKVIPTKNSRVQSISTTKTCTQKNDASKITSCDHVTNNQKSMSTKGGPLNSTQHSVYLITSFENVILVEGFSFSHLDFWWISFGQQSQQSPGQFSLVLLAGVYCAWPERHHHQQQLSVLLIRVKSCTEIELSTLSGISPIAETLNSIICYLGVY